jgi:heat shock protein HslJ
MKSYLFTSIFILALTITSCRTSKATMPVEILTGTTWELTSLNGNNVAPVNYSRGVPYITFGTDNKITGSSGCNSFSGSYNLNDAGGMNVSQVMSTKMYCEGVDEKAFFDTLDKVTTAKAENDKLTFMSGMNEIMVFVPKK